MNCEEILNLTFYSNDLHRTVTVREFFIELLKKLFEDMECFSGKRPFGNSDWDYDLYNLFLQNNLIEESYEDFEHIIQLLLENL